MQTYYGNEDDRFWPAILAHLIFTFPYEELLPKDVNRMRSIHKHILKYIHYLYIKTWRSWEKKKRGVRLGKKDKAKLRFLSPKSGRSRNHSAGKLVCGVLYKFEEKEENVIFPSAVAVPKILLIWPSLLRYCCINTVSRVSGWLSFQLRGFPSVLKWKFLCLDIQLKEKKGAQKRRRERKVLIQLIGDYASTVTTGTYLGALIVCSFINKPEGLLLRRHPESCTLPAWSHPTVELIPH